jgi:integrase/recombinase XerD
MELKVSTKKKNKTVVKDYGPVLIEAQYDTSRMDSPGKFTFSLVENSGIDIEMGSQIQVKIDKTEFFKGYVFSAERSRNRKVKYVAYDQFRYLKAKASYTFVAAGLEDIIKQIGNRAGIHVYPHKLRHTFATIGLRNGIPIDKLQTLMGHADPKTTLIYAEQDKSQIQMEHLKAFS